MADTDHPQPSDTGDAADAQGTASPGRRRLPAWLTPRVGLAALGLPLLVAGILYIQSRDDGPTPHEQLSEALELIDRRDDFEARTRAVEIARSLRKLGYRDPDFAGGTEFVLGMAAFRNAAGMDEVQRDRRYLIATSELKRCEALAIDESRRAEWAFALGSSLYEIGKATADRPLLEEAVETFPPGRIEASTRLVDIYLDLKTEEVLLQAIPLLEAVVATRGLSPSVYDAAHLRSAQVFLALGRQAEAEQALQRVSGDTRGNQGTIVFRAQTLMAEAEAAMAEAAATSDRVQRLTQQSARAAERGRTAEAAGFNSEADALSDRALMQRKQAEEKYRTAMRQLEPVAGDVGLEQTFARQASYLLGLCAEEIGDVDAAINLFERTAEKYARSQEGTAANLRAADLLRRAGRSEEALNKRYAAALQSVTSPEDFRNRWLSLERFRERVRTAWEEWTDAHAYREAISLAEMMSPLFPQVQSRELAARAGQRWAEHLQQRLRSAPYSQRQPLRKLLRERWQASGKAYADLASELTLSPEYPDAVRTSAEHYARGHDFQQALRQWNRFIETRPDALLAEALVKRGQVLMDLDRLDEALGELQQVIDNFPTDAAAFEAQYAIGLCRWERNELDEAERIWRGMITSDALTPAARQWQLALLSLGRLLYQTAAMKKAAADSPRGSLSPDERQSRLDEAFARWDEAIQYLELFLAFVARDERHDEAVRAVPEARYLLARALRQSAERPRRKLESAETENARTELRRTVLTLLGQARDHYRTLQAELLALEEIDMLGDLEQRLLRDCYFELAHTYFTLAENRLVSAEEYDNKAIVAYSSAANKYSRDPQVVLAYLQISRCYERLGKPSDARSSLEQARVILKQMPEAAFASSATSLNKQEWQTWLEWMQTLGPDAVTRTAQRP